MVPRRRPADHRQTTREVVGRRKDGTRFALELAVSQFYDEKGLRFVGIVRDITQRRHATTTNANAWRSWYASTASVSSASSESASPTR